jgi:hypothetical protein
VSPVPGPTVTIIDAPPPPAPASDTGAFFVVGFGDRGAAAGPLAATDAITSLGDFTARYGARQTYNGPEYDAIDAFFAEGGSRLFFSRKVGPAAVKAQVNVPTASPKFTATAKGPGASYNTLTVGVASGVITVYDNAVAVEVSPAQASVTDAQLWASSSSRLIDIAPVGTGALTDSAPVALTGGADDRTNVTDTQVQAALDRFGKDLGPGQVALPGDGRQAAYTMLATHARDRNRFAYGDAPDSSSYTTVTGLAASTRALGRELARHIQLLDPWVYAPGTAAGTTRTVPPSGVQAGMAARSDAAGNPNRAVAGRNAISRFATAPKYQRLETERQALADAGVTVLRLLDGVVQTYDDVTPVDGTVEPEWLGAAGNRFVMWVIARTLQIAGAHMFDPIAGAGSFAAFNGDLVGFLTPLVNSTIGPLYGDTPQEAFRVETGPAVNTPATIMARQLKAALSLKIAPNARFVTITVTNQQLSEVL